MEENSKRLRERVSFETKMIMEHGGKSHIYMHTYDVSMNGAFVQTPNPLPLGASEKFSLILSFGAKQEKINGLYEVVRLVSKDDIGPESERGPGMGIKFLEFEPGADELLFNVVRYNKSDD